MRTETRMLSKEIPDVTHCFPAKSSSVAISDVITFLKSSVHSCNIFAMYNRIRLFNLVTEF